MNVFSYWEGDRPEFIDLCLASMADAFGNEEFHLVTPETLGTYLAPNVLHPSYTRLLLGSQVGCIRAALLAAHGGWWCDADTIAMQSPQNVLDTHPGADVLYMSWREQPRRLLNGYIYMDPDIAAEWLSRINWRLEHDFASIKWCTLGEGILTPLLNGHDTAVEVGRELFLPIDVDSDVERFFRPGDPSSFVTEATVCFGLNHSYMMHHHGKAMRPPWDRDILIHHLFNQLQERIT